MNTELLRCLGFTEQMKEVSMWPVWLCSIDTVNEAVAAGFLKIIRKDPLIPRLGKWAEVYGLTDEGRGKFYLLLEEFNGHPRGAPQGM